MSSCARVVAAAAPASSRASPAHRHGASRRDCVVSTAMNAVTTKKMENSVNSTRWTVRQTPATRTNSIGERRLTAMAKAQVPSMRR